MNFGTKKSGDGQTRGVISSRMNVLRLGIFYSLVVASVPAAKGQIDGNDNGVSDVWEMRYDAVDLVADELSRNADEDGDGFSNYEEGIAGTDPRDPLSKPRLNNLVKQGGKVSLSGDAQRGKKYQLYRSIDLSEDSWQPAGSAVLADSSALLAELTGQLEQQFFYRFEVLDHDGDNDGLSDWDELHLEGFDRGAADSFSADSLASDMEVWSALAANNIEVFVDSARAYEKEQQPAEIRLVRSGDTNYAQRVYLRVKPSDDSEKGAAQADDYKLVSQGQELTNYVVIPAGSDSVLIEVHANLDQQAEVPEKLTIQAAGQLAELEICDATNTFENQKLFIAYLRPEDNAVTTASGLATILLEGDNSVGSVQLSFHGLTSLQTAAHMHLRNPVSGPHIESLPLGQVSGHSWAVEAAQFITTDQGMLDALYQGQIYINVHSAMYPAGEIRGDFSQQDAGTELIIPDSPPEITVLEGDELNRDIVRFLTQASFGATPDTIKSLRKRINNEHGGDRMAGYEAWIDDQLGMAMPSMEKFMRAMDQHQISHFRNDSDKGYFNEGYNPGVTNRETAWWLLALHAKDQLRQRMTFALSEVYVTSRVDPVIQDRAYGHTNYYDMLMSNAFGDFRTLLEDVSTHPIMGQYLSSLGNQKAVTNELGEVIISPDENYARELMQLFSIGLIELHLDGSIKLGGDGLPIATYEQEDIVELARVFTGWSYSIINEPKSSLTEVENDNFSYSSGKQYYESQWMHRMKNFAEYHDDGSKALFVREGIAQLEIPAGGDGESDLEAVMNYLASHDNVAPFMARRLIQRFVTSNPSAGYIYRVASKWQETDGNLGEVVKAILLDYEARSVSLVDNVGYGKKKEPLIHVSAVIRALDGKSEIPLDILGDEERMGEYAWGNYALKRYDSDATIVRFLSSNTPLGQRPLAAPSVFNWFLPSYSPVGILASSGAVAPEFQIANEVSVINHINFLEDLLRNDNGVGLVSLPYLEDEPYLLSKYADHLVVDRSANSGMGKVYMNVMDKNNDGKVSPLDNTFNNREKIVQACEELVDYLDLLLCAGELKRRHAEGYVRELGTDDLRTNVRLDNPRDVIIHAVAMTYYYYDDDEASDSLTEEEADARQELIFNDRLEVAAYLISSCPYSMIQK